MEAKAIAFGQSLHPLSKPSRQWEIALIAVSAEYRHAQLPLCSYLGAKSATGNYFHATD